MCLFCSLWSGDNTCVIFVVLEEIFYEMISVTFCDVCIQAQLIIKFFCLSVCWLVDCVIDYTNTGISLGLDKVCV